MMIALARQELSRTQQAGVLARAALTVAAGRMGGRPPQLILEGEDALQAEIIQEAKRRLKIAFDDGSDEALRAIEDMLDAETDAAAEPVDVDAALSRAAAVMTRIAQAEEVRVENVATDNAAGADFPEGEPAVSRSSLDLQPLAVAAEGPETSRPFLPAPPQERFQEWGKLRGRAPSLFERVTATFSRQRSERPHERDPAVAEENPENAASNAGDRESASTKGRG